MTHTFGSNGNANAALDYLQWFCWHLREMRLLGYSFGDRLPWIMQPFVSTPFCNRRAAEAIHLAYLFELFSLELCLVGILKLPLTVSLSFFFCFFFSLHKGINPSKAFGMTVHFLFSHWKPLGLVADESPLVRFTDKSFSDWLSLGPVPTLSYLCLILVAEQ